MSQVCVYKSLTTVIKKKTIVKKKKRKWFQIYKQLYWNNQ